jgi:transcriptional adapter 3
LEELINGHNDDDEFLKIPPLGRHYSLRWAEDDLMQEQREGSRFGNEKKKVTSSAVANEEAHRLMNSVAKSK